MQKLRLDDLQGLERYEHSRSAFRSEIISLKKNRRVPVGDRVTFVFENRRTMMFQVQEMIRAERIVDIDKLRAELEVYNELIPNRGELSATMLVEITDGSRVREQLAELIGIDEHVSLRIGDRFDVRAAFEPGRSTDAKLSAVQYVRFVLDPAAQRAFTSEPLVSLAITHPSYTYSTELSDNVRQSLAADLAED